MSDLRPDPEAIVQALQVLLDPGQVVELRILHARMGASSFEETQAGYFDTDHLEDLAKAALSVKSASGFYFTLNPVKSDLHARAFNRIRKAPKGGGTTADSEIQTRRWFLIDLDAQRPAGISATDAEKAASKARAQQIRDWLTSQGWPEPVVIDSGNGFHLLYRVSLPTDDAGLVKRCLDALALRFSDAAVHVDKTNFNPSRISKLPGTPVRKGDSTPDRPHRMSKLVKVPEVLEVVPTALLEELAGPVEVKASTKPTSAGATFDLAGFMSAHFPDATGPNADGIYEITCPWRPEDGRSAFVGQLSKGGLTAGCQHATCPGSKVGGNRWKELRAMKEPPSDVNGNVEEEEPPPPWYGEVEEPQSTPLLKIDIRNWLVADVPQVVFLLEDIIPMGEPTILAAKSNAGKSLLALQLAIASATGRGLWCLHGPPAPVHVLFVEMEDSDKELHRRFRRCVNLMREDQDWTSATDARLLSTFHPFCPNWRSEGPKNLVNLVPFILQEVERLKASGIPIGLIVLDTFAALSTGKEVDADVHAPFWAACYHLRDLTGATPLIVHHFRKLPDSLGLYERLNFDNVRGSTAIVAGAQAVVQLEPLTSKEAAKVGLDEGRAAAGNYVAVMLTKMKSGPKGSCRLLEQRQASENGAGFFTLHPESNRICASLRSKQAVATLDKTEAVFLELADGVDRKAIAAKHWPDQKLSDKQRDARLRDVIYRLKKAPNKWLQDDGRTPTVLGFEKVQELRRVPQSTVDATTQESEQWPTSA